jgi:predicted GH43/DUF377 family glycosyl hydrolase
MGSSVVCNVFLAGVTLMTCCGTARAESPGGRWLGPQAWRRDTDGPVVTLGEAGAFDDTHVFAPCVAHEDGTYFLWYPGSRGAVGERLFRLGLATSRGGVRFQKHSGSPVYEFGDGVTSVLTPAVLRNADGTVRRENGRLRMWFTGADLTQSGSPHRLYETSSEDGVVWAEPSAPELDGVYAPTILWDGDAYRMWYADVQEEPWIIRHARSDDGKTWVVSPEPCITIDQEWETRRLFYPCVIKADGVFVMWYGAYWTARENTTALGCAVSEDGLHWKKNAHNPVFRPDPSRSWESHYTSSQSVLPIGGGQYRIWYGTRKAPPHVNKYFAIGTAVLDAPAVPDVNNTSQSQPLR